MRARTQQLILQTLARPLARHFDQAKLGNLQYVGAGFVFFERIPEGIVDLLSIGLLLHVDEVDDNDAADVSQAELAHHFVGSLQDWS